ncbi:hypothetical protein ACFLVD_01380, partial [Chloroflexota bacterium]
MTTVSFTPGTHNDWLIIASAVGRQESALWAFYCRLEVDGTGYDEFIFRPITKTTYRCWYQLAKVNLTTVSPPRVLKIQYHTNNTNANTEAVIKNARITAIELNTAESYNDSG